MSLVGTRFKFGKIVSPPFISECAAIDGNYSTIINDCPQPGIAIELAQMVCDFLKMDCYYESHWDHNYGQVFPNGSLTGFLGAIASGYYDAAVPILTPNPSRMDVLRFTPIVSYDLEAFLSFRNFTPSRTQLRYFSRLDPEVWMYITLSAVLIAIILAGGYALFEGLLWHLFSEFRNAIISMVNIWSAQDPLRHPHSEYAYFRTLMLTWNIVAFIVTAMLGAEMLTYSLTRKRTGLFYDLNSLSHALQNYGLTLVLHSEGVHIDNKLMTTEVEPYISMRSYVRKYPEHLMYGGNMSTWRQLLSECPNCVIWSGENHVKRIAEDDCLYLQVSDTATENGNAFAFPKSSPVYEKFLRVVHILMETGYVNHTNEKYKPKDTCRDEGTYMTSSLILGEIANVFYLWFVGLLMALVQFIADTLMHGNSKSKRDNQ